MTRDEALQESVIADKDARIAELEGDLAHVRGHPSGTFCGICERPLERCECDEMLQKLKAENAELRRLLNAAFQCYRDDECMLENETYRAIEAAVGVSDELG